MHADCADFGVAHPDAGAFRNAARLDIEIRKRIDHGLLDRPHVRAHVALPIAQIQDGVADDLSRPVIRDVAAAVGGMKSDAGVAQVFFAGEQVFHVAVATHGDGVGVLQQDELVGNRAGLTLRYQPLLPLKRARVLDPAGLPPLALKH
jgi:hypothetical protein